MEKCKIVVPTNEFQLGKIELDYTQQKRIKNITIVFLSTDSNNPATKPVKGSDGAWGKGYGDSRHIGSILTVDDVELIYE